MFERIFLAGHLPNSQADATTRTQGGTMATTLTRFTVTVATVLALSAPAVAAPRPATTTNAAGQISGNLQLFRGVQDKILRYPYFTIFDSVNAQVNNGVVTLTGKVTMPYKQKDIAKRVAGVDGVQSVNNQLEVLPVSQFDDELRLRIARAIYSNPAFRIYGSMVNPPIHVIVDKGHVTLEGVVLNDADKTIARAIARSSSAFSVQNDLKTEAEVKSDLEKL
jgi:osmotically-inducible protein OsmY